MPVGTSVIRQSRIHQTQAVQKLCPRTECTADAGNSGALVERKGSRNVQNLIHVRFGCLRHASSRVGGQGVQIPSRSLSVKDSKGQGRLTGAGYAGDTYDLPERHVNVNIFQVVDPRPADQYFIFHV